MEGDEAALLAELRAISNQSATSRFQHDATTAEENLPPPSSNIPPTSGVLNGGGGNFKQESTFSGSNGGEANDEELLALLRGVSAKSSSTDRFANETYEGGYDHSRERPAPAPSKPATLAGKNKRDSNEVPPWKRGNAKEVVKKALSPPPKAPPKAAPAPLLGNFKQESTFTGQNGGDANDEELLALLRGVSAKSSSADRFAGEGPATENTKAVVPAPKPASPSKKERTPPPKAAPAPFTGGGNFKQESTFSGTNGGDANDEELLALLRGVSTKSSSVDRFAKDGEEHAISKDDPIVEEALNQSDEAEFFDANDGYDNSFGKPVSSPPKMEAPSAPPSLMRGGNFKQESTFSGERGGDANDEDLLALLRGVSAKSSSADRFGGDGEGQAAPVREDPKPKKAHTAGPEALPLPKSVLSSIAPPLSGTPFDPMSANPFAGDNPDEVLVTTEDLPTALCSKDWKVRKKAYVLLRQLIIKAGGQGNPSGVVDANAIFSGLDDLIPTKCLMDKNANALETAMELSTVYADYCRGGMDAERAEQMIASLIKGSGFTCPRPSAAKVAEALTLKIMEVGDGNASLNAVIRIVLEQGCSSRKPKIVQASCTIVLKAAYAFGAAYLPLAAITQILPSLLTHANKKVRDTTMEIVAELCRTLGSKDPLEDLISKMKKQQEADLDALLQKQPEPTPVQVGLRSSRHSDGKATQSAEDALAALQVGAAEMEAENFAKRPAVNLLVEMGKTEYADKLKVAKWSEKVAALKIILESGGEKPYKLVQPSPSVNYAPLISDMKGVLSHTHFAVVGKAMEVLSMLAQGVGERLYPNIRPLLPKLFQLSKDKKLTKSASACLDAFFGNIVGFAHILDSDSAIPEAADERYQKNVLARTNAIDFLSRCVTRSESAGPRGHLTAPHAKLSALFASLKLKDSDANVRKSAVNALKTLQAVEDPDVKKVVDGVIQELETSNPRVFKSLSGGSGGVKVRYQSGTSKASVPSSAPQREMTTPSPVKSAVKSVPQKRVASVPPPTSKPVSKATVDSGDAPSLDIAIARCSTLNIPLWDVEEDGGGVLSGLQSSKWQLRKIAINGLAEFVSGREVLDSLTNVELDSNCILVLVKENTRGFRETNFNVTKAILEVFLSLCGYHQKSGQSLSEWAVIDAATLATEKIADKKLSALSQVLLTELCVVREPQTVHSACYATMVKIRAPTAHEEFIKWLNRFCNEFGVASIGPRINETVAFLLEECNSRNIKAKKAAQSILGLMHVQLGATFQAVVFTKVDKDESLRKLVEKSFEDNPHDPTAATAEWSKTCICVDRGIDGAAENASGGGLQLDVPKLDLFSELSSDCVDRMRTKQGKTAWKARKGAMEEVDNILKRCSGLLDTSGLRAYLELCRELCDRLSDTQSNLKPVAARLLGSLLSSVGATAQSKLGKIAYAPLINSAMNENKKIMHDAAMEALCVGTSLHVLEGGGMNRQAIVTFVTALAIELDKSEYKANGISDVLQLTQSFTEDLPDLDHVSSQRGETVGGRFAKVVVNGLSSSKAGIRSSSEALLQHCVTNGVFSLSTARRNASRLKPAEQRSIGPILAKMSVSSDKLEKEELEIGKHAEKKSTSKYSSRGRAPQSTKQSSISSKPREHKPADPELESQNRQPPANSTSSNPLVGNSGMIGKQRSSSALRLMTWPDFPEDPSSSSYYSGLKKAWSSLIPQESIKALFPDTGIRRQDDAMEGCELLKRAIVDERSGEDHAVLEQLNLILKWSVYVLSRKESTVGLQELLSFFADLFMFLKENKYELSDSEAATLLPFLFDKASAAKGRFHDTYLDLLEQCTEECICPPKRLGAFVCVPVIDSSSYPKARLMACKKCYECVELVGLSGIGKKGTLAAAKALSTEKILENHNAFLDLMELILSKMNGDMQRFARICGSSLSPKARDLLEERVNTSKSNMPLKPSPSRSTTTARLQSRSSPTKNASPTVVSKKNRYDGPLNSSFGDSLPALGLRDYSPSGIPRPSPSKLPSRIYRSDSFTEGSAGDILSSLLDAEDMLEETGGVPKINVVSASLPSTLGVTGAKPFTAPPVVQPQVLTSPSNGNPENPNSSSSEVGAAASLRARLQKIREKSKGDFMDESSKANSGITSSSDSLLRGTQNRPSTTEVPYEPTTPRNYEGDNLMHDSDENDKFVEQAREELEKSLDAVAFLISKNTPLREDDSDIFATTDVLKTIHAAVSQQANLAVNLSPSEVKRLRVEIESRANEVVASLTRLIGFGFNCHDKSCSAGISVPLLSVNLASLMAIFRSEDLATQVVVDDLTILIKEAGKALLDKRLANSSSSNDEFGLDAATSTQMVRAINKLAVQAATGAKRDVSLQALLALQQQLSMNAETNEESVFNSRLSRVITKLFSRVIKAEEGKVDSFVPEDFDVESILCYLEDSLVACDMAEQEGRPYDAIAASRNLIGLLMTAMLKARGESFSLRAQLDELGIDSVGSDLGKLLMSCATELGIWSSSPPRGGVTTSRDVSVLVSAVGSAEQDPEREKAIAALRNYISIYGDNDLNDHLAQVSDTFRSFILDQLSSSHQVKSPTIAASNSMSVRIKNLRSKLSSTEPAVETRSMNSTPKQSQEEPFPPNLTQPTTELTAAGSAPAVQAFRARLAAAQEKRTVTTTTNSVPESPVVSESAGSRAAALRARLKKAKREL